ncbi:uncharacterized protein RSE6_11699 [Rhynchosporium secalis]|uniref:Uncharacterized protein n=1 Tax=Rhynchosporium secalis TaxID=38038 RepID=A0A1E1MNL4_RHYSE|nr:uncharacterized protein RSE6_11699 [Rhynchosporium secalis]
MAFKFSGEAVWITRPPRKRFQETAYDSSKLRLIIRYE